MKRLIPLLLITGYAYGQTPTPSPTPTPVPTDCCSSGFVAFDGSGRRFLTATVNSECSGGVHGCEWSATCVVTIDPMDCTQSVTTCSGTMSAVDFGQTTTWGTGNANLSFNLASLVVGYSGTDKCTTAADLACGSLCANSFTPDSATVEHCTSGCGGTGITTITLSDECVDPSPTPTPTATVTPTNTPSQKTFISAE